MSNWVLQLIKLVSLGLIDITPEPKSRFWFSNDSHLRIYIYLFFLVHWDKGTNSTRRNEYKTRSRCLLTKLINVHIEPMVARDQGFAVSSISISYPLSSPQQDCCQLEHSLKVCTCIFCLLLRLFFVFELLATLHIGIKLLPYMTTLVAEKDSLHGCLVPRSP